MIDALRVKNDEAIQLAQEIAERRGISIGAAIVDSLRLARDALAPKTSVTASGSSAPLTSEQQDRYDALLELARELAPFKKPDLTSDHRDLYDENGLPI